LAKDLLYVIPAKKHGKEELVQLLKNRPEIKFVSLVGIDLAGNDTDEKIPIRLFLKDIEGFFNGSAVQTDGSSVVLTGIATLNNAKVDMVIDPDVNWYVDYNYEHIDEETGKPVGTLRIPSFLIHDGVRVDSRSILAQTLSYVKSELIALCRNYPGVSGFDGFTAEEIEDVVFTAGTELEFWVKTPAEKAQVEELSASQVMQENYWQRTRGNARTALEHALLMLEKYGLEPEMGHKEVGGVKAKVGEAGGLSHVMEQMEIDWRFAQALQAADNELQARITIKEAFRRNGLDVTFQAKPIIGVAGNGEHTHVGMAVRLKSGKLVNLFAPARMREDYLSVVGYGAVMGLLKNYEAVNPFITSTNDAFNRLKPGFEAPVCIVTSLGHSYETPSRNRSVLAGLVRDVENPLATRFEVRSPNPFTNTYIALSAIYLAMLDGIKAVLRAGKSTKELEAELSKEPGTPGFYLETERAYRSEHDVFEDYSSEERDRLFGRHPATVWENMENLRRFPEKVAVLKAGGVFTDAIIEAFVAGALLRWKTELLNRIIPENLDIVRSCGPLHTPDESTDADEQAWQEINALRIYLAKDSNTTKSLFTRIKLALQSGDFGLASNLQREMAEKMAELQAIYSAYRKNQLHNC